MTPLRQQMIEAMQQRGFAIKTHKAYLGAVSSLAGYFHQSPKLSKKLSDRFPCLTA